MKARSGRGISIADAAEAAGVSFESLESWESGTGVPSPVQLAAVGRVLGLDSDKLVMLQQNKGHPDPVSVVPRTSGSLRVETLTGFMRGYAVHAYLIYRDGEPDAVLIDTGYEPIRAVEAVLNRRLLLRWVALTHCHHDHMEGAPVLKAQTGARIAVPKAEWASYRSYHREAPDLAVEDGTDVEVSSRLTLRAISTPGHTVGGTCYLTDHVCAVGDALFASSMGRAMSPDGYRSLREAITNRILTLHSDTVLLPGHGPVTTVHDELRNNPFFPVSQLPG
ncbi:MAG TPA: MBL fold metallo-hydrolase [Nitrospiria bacterium]|nr:MBL fold metallo-hydrolase [Nitrospiria bacterium]